MMRDRPHSAKPIAVIGAGRWARELARTAYDLRGDRELVLHSDNHADALREWLSGRDMPSARVTGDLGSLAAAAPAAVIIANAAADHERAIEWALNQGLPALVEKPFTTSLHATRRLVASAAGQARVLCAAHVLRFADYLPEFARHLAQEPEPRAVTIDWADPAQEVRYGERKKYDASVPVYQDCLPHVVSVLETLFPGRVPTLTDLAFERGGALLRLDLRVGAIDCRVRLERHAPARSRRVHVEGRRRWTLDFTAEPGHAEVDGQPLAGPADWASRPRPMAAMVTAFLGHALAGVPDVRLDAGTAVRAAEVMAACEPIYNQRRLAWLALARTTHDAAHEDLRYALAESPMAALQQTIPVR